MIYIIKSPSAMGRSAFKMTLPLSVNKVFVRVRKIYGYAKSTKLMIAAQSRSIKNTVL